MIKLSSEEIQMKQSSVMYAFEEVEKMLIHDKDNYTNDENATYGKAAILQAINNFAYTLAGNDSDSYNVVADDYNNTPYEVLLFYYASIFYFLRMLDSYNYPLDENTLGLLQSIEKAIYAGV